jgi:hypothetical protein
VTDPDIEPWGLGPVQPAYQTTKFNDVPPHIMGGAGHYIHQSTYATLTRDAVDKEYPTEVATHYYDSESR